MQQTNLKSLFLTGATGYIGGGILREFLNNGWSVTAIVRDLQKAKYLENLGNVRLVLGQNEDFDLLKRESKNHDAIIHAGQSSKEPETIESLCEAAIETSNSKNSIFIYCSGCLVLGEGQEEKDDYGDRSKPFAYVAWKVATEDKIVSLNKLHQNLYTAVIRPTWVYGNNTGNYVSQYLSFCRKNGYVPAPEQHILADLSKHFYLVASKNINGFFNATDSKYITAQVFVQEVAKHLKVEIKTEAFDGLFGKIGFIFNQKVVTKRGQEIGWVPAYSSITENLEKVFNELGNGTQNK